MACKNIYTWLFTEKVCHPLVYLIHSLYHLKLFICLLYMSLVLDYKIHESRGCSRFVHPCILNSEKKKKNYEMF